MQPIQRATLNVKSVIAISFCLLSLFLLDPISSWAQQVTAAITGQVTDPTGAPILGAKVTATDLERGTEYPTTSNADGYYRLPQVAVGKYTIKVENAGFQAATQSNVTLQMNQVAKLDFQLQVGNVQTTVEVTASAPVLQTESTLLGQVIDSRTNTTLPLATRNYVQLTLLTAGSVHPDPSSFTNGQTTSSSGRPYVNGNREQANNFILDGLDNNQVSDNLVGYAPSVDAIQEFNEITQNAPAEFGNFMGAIVSTSIKSGTNQYHGDAFEFLRNDKLNANSWSNNFEGSPRAKLRWNEFGATLGGPIKKDKLFFFVDYQGQRFDTPTSIGATSLMTAAERSGDFSALLPGVQLYDPLTVVNGQRQPFAGNIIPANRLRSGVAKDRGRHHRLSAADGLGPDQQLPVRFSYFHQRGSRRRQARLESQRKGPHLRPLFAEHDLQSKHEQRADFLQLVCQLPDAQWGAGLDPHGLTDDRQ